VDGSHLFEDVFIDAYYAARLLEQGGLIAFDDSTKPEVAKVLRFIRTNMRQGLEEIDLMPFRENSKDFVIRVARRLGKLQLTAFRRVGEIDRPWNAALVPF